MRKNLLFFFMVLCLCGGENPAANSKPDFVVSDIVVLKDRFIHIKLQNRSARDFRVTPGIKEKIFLVIYINNIKRAEYKVKYIDAKLFKKKSTILFRTNFRIQRELKIKVEINRLKIIPESNFKNNTLIKRFAS
jgi:hypothetical protein